jgi:hypothetical protein
MQRRNLTAEARAFFLFPGKNILCQFGKHPVLSETRLGRRKGTTRLFCNLTDISFAGQNSEGEA